MKTIQAIGLALVLLLSSFQAKAQVDTMQLRRALLDQFKCMVMKQVLEDSDSTNNYANMLNRIDNCTCNSPMKDTIYSELKGEKNSLNKPLMEEIDGLWEKNKKRFVIDTTQQLFYDFWCDTLFKSDQLAVFKKKRAKKTGDNGKITFIAFQTKLDASLRAVVSQFVKNAAIETKVSAIDTSNSHNGGTGRTDPPTEAQDLPFWLMALLVINLIGSGALMYWVWSVKKKLQEQINTKENKKKSTREIGSIAANSSDDTINKMQGQLNKLSDKLYYIEGQLQEKAVKPTELYSEKPISPKEVRYPKKYFANPNTDGTFNQDSAKSQIIEGATIYEFELEDSATALFSVLNTQQASANAFSNVETALKPVCIFSSYNPQARRIRTVKKGKARLEGGKWVVAEQDKAEIVFE